jgi:hypothetical protein
MGRSKQNILEHKGEQLQLQVVTSKNGNLFFELGLTP